MDWWNGRFPICHQCSPMLALPLLFPSFIVCVILFLLFFRTWHRSAASPFPPGPLSLPILGHLHLFRQLPHRSLHRLSKVHGPLIGLRLGSVPVIVASTPDMAKEILQTHDSAFASRPRTSGAVYLTLDRSSVGTAPNGSYWRLMRQLVVTDLFSKKRLEASRPAREEELSAFLQSIWKDSIEGAPVPLRSRFASAAFNIISRMALGKKSSDLFSADVGNLFTEISILAGVFNIGDFIPCLQWMDLQGYVRRMKRVGDRLRTAFQGIIDERRQAMVKDHSCSPPTDLLDVLLSAALQESQLNVPITDDNIKGVLAGLFGAAIETTAVTVEWAFAELLREPAIMKKLRDEIESGVGKGRLLRESDVAQLPYLRAVVKETMRLHPAGGLTAAHESTRPCVVAGYHIPAKTVAYVNLWAIGRDASAWERPLEFWPERFLGSDVEVRGSHFQLLPFGSGRRGCPGWALGLANVEVMVGSLVQAFEWSETERVKMAERLGLIVGMAKPLVAWATRRLPAHLYHAP